MANRIKGITVEIGGDTTKLDKALQGVNKELKQTQSELKDVDRLLKLDPKNVTLLAQKQDLLQKSIAETGDKLKTLKEAAKQASDALANGEISKSQYDALQREIISTEQDLKKLEAQAKDTAKAMSKIGNAGEGLKEIGGKIQGVGSKLMPVTKAIGAVGGALAAAAEGTREYRADLGKLDAAFTTTGKTVETARKTMAGVFALIGEDDRSIETANHLAELTDKEEELADWTGTILPGVFAKFGDSLPIEGLTEAANETAKVGKVTGPLADALTWAGLSEEEFNLQLEACNSEAERSTLITKTLTKTYNSAAQAYKSTSGEVMGAYEAQLKLTNATADLGAKAEPVLTKLKTLLAGLLTALGKVLDFVGNLPTPVQNVLIVLVGLLAVLGPLLIFVGSIISAVGTIMTILPTLTGILGVVKGAVLAVNAALLANPIALVIAAVVALIAIFVTLWNKCEWFRNFWINLWNGIKNVVVAVWNGIKSVVGGIVDTIIGGISKAVDWIKALPAQALQWGKDMIMGFVNGIKSAIGWVADAAKGVAGKIKSLLHFSVPDEGPLTDYESWMPDFMKGLADGINKSKYLVADAVKGVAADMVINPNVQTDAAGSVTRGGSGGGDMMQGLTVAGGGDNIQIPVYIGGTLLDEIVVNSKKNVTLRSGGFANV